MERCVFGGSTFLADAIAFDFIAEADPLVMNGAKGRPIIGKKEEVMIDLYY